jgi:two-component system chemotaxis response regulator CheY
MTYSILLASDSCPLRQSIYQSLSRAGYQIFEAANGQEALAKMESQDSLDLLLIDAALPDMDGIQLTKQIRNISLYRFLPIVVLSAIRYKSLEVEGLAAGVTGWLNQPITTEQLQMVINRLLP